MKRCEWCDGPMVPREAKQRFCSRECSTTFHVAKRKQAVAWFEACGMEVQREEQHA